jgi:hypothetical protein
MNLEKIKLLTKNSTNQEIIEAFGEETLNDGKVRIFALEETKNESYTSMFLVQGIKTANNNKVLNTFLGWSNTRIIRCIQNSTTEIANAFSIGDFLEGFGIRVEEKQLPAYEGQAPKVYPSTHPAAGEQILFEDAPIYEHSFLTTKDEEGIFKLTSENVEQALAISKNVEEVPEKETTKVF